jgi:hypothetical protein
MYSSPSIVLEADYEAGDTFEINVGVDWGFG